MGNAGRRASRVVSVATLLNTCWEIHEISSPYINRIISNKKSMKTLCPKEYILFNS